RGERCHKRTRTQASEEHSRLLWRSRSAERNHVARTHSVALKRDGHAIHQRVEICEGKTAVVLHQCWLLRSSRRVLTNDVGDVAKRRVKHAANARYLDSWAATGTT